MHGSKDHTGTGRVCMLVLLNELYGMSERDKGRQQAEEAC
jgi:hypothetical protein